LNSIDVETELLLILSPPRGGLW
jgi:hypothetical protein